MGVNGILGIKLGMTQVFADDGTAVPCTVLQAGPCVVVERRDERQAWLRSGADGPGRIHQAAAREQGHDRALQEGQRRADAVSRRRSGSRIRRKKRSPATACWSMDSRSASMVDVSGVSKGKGFQGGVKRWHFRGGDASHGSMFHRAPGGIGASSFPSRVWKGQHFPGHMGNERKTSKNLRVVRIDTDENLLLVRGAVPGPAGAYILIRKAKAVGKTGGCGSEVSKVQRRVTSERRQCPLWT